MRFDLLLKVTQKTLDDVYGPRLTLRSIEDTLRRVMRADPLKAERAVGALYGHVFKNKEIRYDAAGGRWLPDEGWS